MVQQKLWHVLSREWDDAYIVPTNPIIIIQKEYLSPTMCGGIAIAPIVAEGARAPPPPKKKK